MYNTNKYDAILFDMDGTVLQSENLFSKAELMLLKHYGVEASMKDLEEFRGMAPEEFYRNFKIKFNITEKTKILKKQLIIYLYKIFEDNLRYVDGFEDFYNTHVLDQMIGTALVTNTSRNIVDKVIEITNINNYFKTIITSSDVLNQKPHPDPYLKAMEILGVKASKTLLIEDSSIGIQSALNTGADVIVIKTSLAEIEINNIDDKLISCDNYMQISKFLNNI